MNYATKPDKIPPSTDGGIWGVGLLVFEIFNIYIERAVREIDISF